MEFSLKIKKQRGFLLILATVLVVIVSFVSFMLINMFVSGYSSEINVTQSQKALYIAMSGLEMAKRDIVANKIQCSVINGTAKYTAANIANGQVTVTGSNSATFSTLSTSINNTDLNPAITLSSVAGFTTDGGVVRIDNELFYYTAISGNTLLNVKRGVSGTLIAAHISGATAMQVQCALTAVGAVPTIASPGAKRTVRQILPALPFVLNNLSPVVLSLGPVLFKGTPFVINPMIWSGSANFIGSTVVSASTVTFNSNATATQICSCGTSACFSACSGGSNLVDSSTRNVSPGDVVPNYTGIDSTNLFSKFFSISKLAMRDYVVMSQPATKYFSSGLTELNSLNGINGTTIWVNGDIDVHGGGDATVGTVTNPVILFVDGPVTFHGSPKLTVNGLLYITGDVETAGSGSIYGAGMIVTEGSFYAHGSDKMVMDAQALGKLPFINLNWLIDYSGNAASTQEIFN